jgi:two-component system chemotaxis response regulator CheB
MQILQRVPKVILIGTSAGGVDALKIILKALPNNFSVPIVVIHHLPANTKTDFTIVYKHHTALAIRQVEDKDTLQNGTVYFAPPNYHVLIERDLTLSLDVDEPVRFSRPSIDVTFQSAAKSLGRDQIAILLTGANDDGARGLAEIKNQQGYTIVQDPATAQVSYMPQSALRLMKPDQVCTLTEIAPSLIALCERRAM